MDLGTLTGDSALAGTEISNLVFSSSDVGPGSLFFCVKGFASDGHDYAADAVSRGAAALICERPMNLGVPESIVGDARAAMPRLARRFYGDPSAGIDVVGITGTNGKTTVGYLIRQILEAAGRPCGLVGTVEWVIAGAASPAVRTTPEAIELQRALRAMVDGGDRACAIEVSSHALELGRVDGVSFAAAIFTNLTQDHLDFHSSMEEYFQAKRVLFEKTSGALIVNIDDQYGRRIAADFDCITYSAAGASADYRATEIQFDATGSRFICETANGSMPVSIRLPGSYNVANALSALAACVSLGVSPAVAVAALATASGAPGRFEVIENDAQFDVVIDYAHTPEAIENVLSAASGLAHGKLIAVFGAGGDRDAVKRPLMGAAAARTADVVIVTSDNPRSEDPALIAAAVHAGAEATAELSGARVEVELDRHSAIERAVAEAAPGDLIVICGKGHEQGQEFENGRKVPFDDATVAREALQRMGAER